MASYTGSGSVRITGLTVSAVALQDHTDGTGVLSQGHSATLTTVNEGDHMSSTAYGVGGALLGAVSCVAGFSGAGSIRVFPNQPPGGTTTFQFYKQE